MKTLLVIIVALAVVCFGLGYLFARIVKKTEDYYDKHYNQPFK